MDIKAVIATLQECDCVSFPAEAWTMLFSGLKKGGPAEIIANREKYRECLVKIGAYCLHFLGCKLGGDHDAPQPTPDDDHDGGVIVVDSQGPSFGASRRDNEQEAVTAGLYMTLHEQTGLVVQSHGWIRNGITKRLLALVVSYLCDTLEDPRDAQKYFDAALAHIVEAIK